MEPCVSVCVCECVWLAELSLFPHIGLIFPFDLCCYLLSPPQAVLQLSVNSWLLFKGLHKWPRPSVNISRPAGDDSAPDCHVIKEFVVLRCHSFPGQHRCQSQHFFQRTCLDSVPHIPRGIKDLRRRHSVSEFSLPGDHYYNNELPNDQVAI